MLNRIIVMGRMVRDPELRTTTTGTPVANFTLAVDRDFKSKDSGEKSTDFIDCVVWRSTAEFVCKYFGKGRMAVVDGRLQIREWKDKEGNNRHAAEIVAESVYFGDSKKEESGSFGAAGTTYDAQTVAQPMAQNGGFTEIPDSSDDGDLPF